MRNRLLDTAITHRFIPGCITRQVWLHFMGRWWLLIFHARMAWIARAGGIVLREMIPGLWGLRRGCACFGAAWRVDGWMAGVFRFLRRGWVRLMLLELRRRRF